ncbi:tumor necrosis factor receptor superfamily member 10A-like [Emydura macquarii macquarii]|uniref:tumor necrosis factor receptor superfamily member 10A-like n=1 Tax=Emydura macquarii macquarii TaxID=1129001 RepID=UPI00352A3AB8
MIPVCASRLLLLCLLAEARSASVLLTPDPEGPQLIPEALNRSTEVSEFYGYAGRLCRKCPAGFHVLDPCVTSNTSGNCSPCKEGAEFTEYPNALTKCLTCRVCRKDEVQLRPCSSIKNTQCACKNGTFCSPDHPCEICQRCRARCPEGVMQISACTPQSDIQCLSPTGLPPAAGGVTGLLAVWIILLLVIVGLIGFFLWWYCRNSSSGGDHRKKSPSFKARFLSPLRNCTRGRLGTQDNMRNEQLDQESQRELLAASDSKKAARKASGCQLVAPPTAVSAPEHQMLQTNPAPEMEGRRRKLVPVRGKDPTETLRYSFDIFSQEVPCKDWRRFVRALLLSENEIENAERSDKYSQEQHYQMLIAWQNKAGIGASINQLLETLDKIDLRGVADIICSKLNGLYEEEALN